VRVVSNCEGFSDSALALNAGLKVGEALPHKTAGSFVHQVDEIVVEHYPQGPFFFVRQNFGGVVVFFFGHVAEQHCFFSVLSVLRLVVVAFFFPYFDNVYYAFSELGVFEFLRGVNVFQEVVFVLANHEAGFSFSVNYSFWDVEFYRVLQTGFT